MDKNTLLGLLLMGLVIFGFMWLNQPDQQKLQETEQAAAIDRQQKEAAEAERSLAADTLTATERQGAVALVLAAGTVDAETGATEYRTPAVSLSLAKGASEVTGTVEGADTTLSYTEVAYGRFGANVSAENRSRATANLRKALADAVLKASDLAKVLMVGGSTRIPAVYDAVKKELNCEPFKGINPDECVAVGASIQGGVLQGDVKGLLLLDVTPLSLGIETLGGVCTKIIERNTTIPTHKSQIFSTAADNQPSVEVNVLQGEREFARDNKSLGTFHLDGIAPAPRGVPQIEVTFDIDANGIVHVSAKDLGTGKEQSITITASTNMSKDDIDKAVKDAEQYAAEDKKRREDVDTRNNADQMVFQTEKALGELGDKVSPSEKSECEAKLNALKEALKGTDIEAIKAKQDDLQKAFYAISEKVYQQAAQQQGQQPGADAQQGPTGNAGSAPKDDGAVDADFHEV